MRFSLPARSSLDGGRLSRRALLALAAASGLAACGPSGGTSGTSSSGSTGSAPAAAGSASASASSPTPTPTPPPQLPGGGRTIFPAHRLFGYCGAPGAPGQGQLGIGDLETEVERMIRRSASYARGRKVLPVMELIVSTVQPRPGKDGKWRSRIDESVIGEWLAMARKHKALLLLNIQPGQANFVDELKSYEKWLVNPDVGVALDPEWRMWPGEVPMRTFGHVNGTELNACATYLGGLVAQHDLPEKVMVFHQVSPSVIRNEKAMVPVKGVAMVKSVDGIGSPGAKVGTYNGLMKTMPKFVHPGFKLFFQEDVQQGGRLMTPNEVMALKPVPEYVLFE